MPCGDPFSNQEIIEDFLARVLGQSQIRIPNHCEEESFQWWLKIIKAEDGFVLEDYEGKLYPIEVDEDDESDHEVTATVKMLWQVIEYFNLRGSRYDEKRPVVTLEEGDKFEDGV